MSTVNSATNGAIESLLSGSSSSTTKNSELTTESFFKLIAAQLQNQDMSNPMDNSEMMTQMTQIAMMQAMNNFSTAMDDFAQINTIKYGASMMGKNVVIYNPDGKPEKLSGTVTRVDIFGGKPTVFLGDETKKGYPVSYVMSVYEEGHEPTKDTDDDLKKTDGDSKKADGDSKKADGDSKKTDDDSKKTNT
jgi:flagellar basal-body rod modification protein FlgD